MAADEILRTPLAVEESSKLERNREHLLRKVETSHPFYSLLKCVVTFLVFVTVLGCLVFSKVSALKIGESLNRTNSADMINNKTIDWVYIFAEERSFLMIIVMLSVPYAWTFIWSLRKAFDTDCPWPDCPAIFLGLFCSTCEVIGQSLFMLHIVPRFKAEDHLVIVFMSCILIVPVCKRLAEIIFPRKCCVRNGGRGFADKLLTYLATASLILGMVLLNVFFICDSVTIRKIRNSEVYEWLDLISAMLSILLISIAWLPDCHIRQIQPCSSYMQNLPSVPSSPSMPNMSNGQSSFTQYGTLPNPVHDCEAGIVDTPVEYRGRWKSGSINSFYKMIITPGVCFLIAYVLREISPHTIRIDFSKLGPDGGLAGWTSTDNDMLGWFLVNIVTGFLGYLVSSLACIMGLQKIAFALPIILSTPVSIPIIYVVSTCQTSLSDTFYQGMCNLDEIVPHFKDLPWAIPITIALCLAQIFSVALDVWKSQSVILASRSNLFWLQGYSSVFLEHWLLLNKKTNKNDLQHTNPETMTEQTRVYICTTMYREAEHEMEQLLRSIGGVNRAQLERRLNFESHIFLDNGCKGPVLQEFALQLVSLLGKTLDIEVQNCTKLQTPYGMSISWRLPGDGGMKFTIHLKDNAKVKNKKRWSQIMYMSYVIDYLLKEAPDANEENAYILTTDADVKFSPESVEALLDLMNSDRTAGAVCARTHPLGSGPLVWYQVFDYAIGHWFQKTANHVLGSVLCSPGCFSVYRVKAVRDIVSLYASNVEQASEFLTKDMGEDRWLCTLMVQSGWRLKYSALASDSTYCPEEFDEFFKQRRRWIPSTLANQVLLLQEWSQVRKFNRYISLGFLLYQALLLFSTFISPAMTVLVIAGGVEYGVGISPSYTITFMVLACLVFGVICVKASSETQLVTAKILTFLFAVVMCIVGVGTAAAIGIQLAGHAPCLPTPTPFANHTMPNAFPLISLCEPSMKSIIPGSNVDGSTLYLAILAGLFFITACMHPTELFCLVHGLWYILCLPSGYLLLIIYSLCNITDRSWGTREMKTRSIADDESWLQVISRHARRVFSLCCKIESSSSSSVGPSGEAVENFDTEGAIVQQAATPSSAVRETPEVVQEGFDTNSITSSTGFRFPGNNLEERERAASEWSLNRVKYMSTSDWLESIVKDSVFKKKYLRQFEHEGYTDASFIVGITDEDLKKIGVSDKYDRRILLDQSRLIHEYTFQASVPHTVSDWLGNMGLKCYIMQFSAKGIDDSSPRAMERLKEMSSRDIEQYLGVRKLAHLKRIVTAIKHIRFPTEREVRMEKTKAVLEVVPLMNLRDINPATSEFWERLREKCLKPKSQLFDHDLDMKEKLESLRNSTLVAFVVANVLWLTLSVTLDRAQVLSVFGANALGLCFLFVFGVLLIIQFICMIFHRFWTGIHTMARAPFRPSKPWKQSFTFTVPLPEEVSVPDSQLTPTTRRRRIRQDAERQPLLAAPV